MPRACSVCNRAEVRLAVDSALRSGRPQIEIAQEYQFSVDAVARHFKNHVRQDVAKSAVTVSMKDRLELLSARADELYVHATGVGDVRGAVDALTRLATLTESLSKIQVQESGFESLSVEAKIAYVKADGDLYRGVLDDMVKATDRAVTEAKAKGYRFDPETGLLRLTGSEKPVQSTDSVQ